MGNTETETLLKGGVVKQRHVIERWGISAAIVRQRIMDRLFNALDNKYRWLQQARESHDCEAVIGLTNQICTILEAWQCRP